MDVDRFWGTPRCFPAMVGVDHAVAVFEARALDQGEHVGRLHPDAVVARWDLACLFAEIGHRAALLGEVELLAYEAERVLDPDEPLTVLLRRAVVAARHDAPTAEIHEAMTEGAGDALSLRAAWVRAHVLVAQGVRAEALDHAERLVADAGERLEAGDPVAFLARCARASCLWALGRWETAVACFEDVARDAGRELGPGHLETLRAWGSVASAYELLTRPHDALAAFERLEAACEESLGHDHDLTRIVAQRAGAIRIALSPRQDGFGPDVYDGPYVADGGDMPTPWLWVANGTRPREEMFAPPRSVSEQEAAQPDLYGAWLERAMAAHRAAVAAESEVGSGTGAVEAVLQQATGGDEPAGGAGGAGTAEPADGTDAVAAGGDVAPAGAGGDRGVAILVLGPVEATGWEAPPERAVVTELACYLALHRERPIHGDELRVALRPEGTGEVSATTLRSYLSHLRRALGPGVLPTGQAGGYRLGDAVATDWERFVALARPGAPAEDLRAALALVRGRPFAGVPAGTYDWVYAELLVSDMEVAIADAARRLAGAAVAAGDLALAAWATRQGLVGATNDFALWQLHLDVAAREGPAAVERARREAVAVLGADAGELGDGVGTVG